MKHRKIEVCLSPALLPYCLSFSPLVIVVDVLRATTSICTAFDFGVEAIIPVASLDEARFMKQQGYLVAAERDGVVLDFADFGNSAFNFMTDKVKGQTIVYSTTNGTQTIATAASLGQVVIGAFSNLTALGAYAARWPSDVLIVCSGWKNRFNLEDTLFAGALAQRLAVSYGFSTSDDATLASIELWNQGKGNLQGYLEAAEHRERLRRLHLDDVLAYTFTLDTCQSVPVMQGNILTDSRRIEQP